MQLTPEQEAAYKVIVDEKNARVAAFQTELQALCEKYYINLSEAKIVPADVPTQLPE